MTTAQLPKGRWNPAQRRRMQKLIDTFSVNNPMIVSEQNWYALKENNMLDMSRTLVKTKEGLIVKIPFRMKNTLC